MRDDARWSRPDRPRWRSGRTILAPLLFLVVFSILLVIVSNTYLLPAVRAARTAAPPQRRELAAWSVLILTVLLVVLLGGLFLTMRLSRFFFPAKQPPRTKTTYVDAWSESAKRMPTPPAEGEDQSD